MTFDRVHVWNWLLSEEKAWAVKQLKNQNTNFFLICKEIQLGAVAKSYMRKGFLIYNEMCKYSVINEEDVSHILLCNRSLVDFLIYEENVVFFFISEGG